MFLRSPLFQSCVCPLASVGSGGGGIESEILVFVLGYLCVPEICLGACLYMWQESATLMGSCTQYVYTWHEGKTRCPVCEPKFNYRVCD